MLRLILLGLYFILDIYWWIMIIGIILTWAPGFQNYKIPRIIREVSDWYLAPFHGKIVIGILDFSPIIGFMIYSGILSLVNRVIFL